jgi:hypothetical protein
MHLLMEANRSSFRNESADGYHRLVAHLNRKWRVIECREAIQWILQHRGSPETARRDDWRGRSYCRTSEALIRCTREYCGFIDPTAAAVLSALPETIEIAARGAVRSEVLRASTV